MLAAAVNGIPIFLGGFYLCVSDFNSGQNSHPQGNPFIWEAIPTVSFPFITYWCLGRSGSFASGIVKHLVIFS